MSIPYPLNTWIRIQWRWGRTTLSISHHLIQKLIKTDLHWQYSRRIGTTIVRWKLNVVLAETVKNAWRISIIFFRYLVMSKEFLTFLQKVGVYGKERMEDSSTITEKGFIKSGKLPAWQRLPLRWQLLISYRNTDGNLN